jgi:hypothetical protein
MTIQALSQEGVTAKIDWVSGKVVPRTFYVPTFGKGLAQNWRRHPMAGTLITRLAWAVSVLLLTFVGLAPPSAAQLPPFPSCPNFDVRLEIQSARNRVARVFTDRDGNLVRVLSAGKGDTLTFTNDVTGERLVLTTGGSVSQITPNPDGTLTFVGTGHNVILLFPSDTPGPATTLYVGRVIFTLSGDNNDVFTLRSFTGTSTDICAALSD